MIPTKKATSNLFWDENVIVWFSNPEGYLITIRRKNINKYELPLPCGVSYGNGI